MGLIIIPAVAIAGAAISALTAVVRGTAQISMDLAKSPQAGAAELGFGVNRFLDRVEAWVASHGKVRSPGAVWRACRGPKYARRVPL